MTKADPYGLPRLGYPVKEFCASVPMGLSTYYKLKREGKTPPECRIGSSGGKPIIRREDAEAWLLSLREAPQPSNAHNQCSAPIAHSPELAEQFT